MDDNGDSAGERQVSEPHSTVELSRAVRTGGEDDTGTGWPAEPSPKRRPRRHLIASVLSAPRRWALGAVGVLAAIVLIVVLVLVTQALGWLPKVGNPFEKQTTDRSGPVLLLEIRDLSHYVAAEGEFQVVIDVQQDYKYVPDFLKNQRWLFVATGTVEAYVDFAGIGDGAIIESADRKSVSVKLPAPALSRPNIDHSKSYVFAEEKGLWDRLTGIFGGDDPNYQQLLYELADQKIGDAAKQAKLTDRASENTRKMLESLLHSLGYTTTEITFVTP